MKAAGGARRIAIMISSLRGGGAERKALLIASALQDRGHVIDLLLRTLACDYPAQVPKSLRVLYLRRDTGAEGQLERLHTVPQSLIPYPTPWRARFPRAALASVLPRRQLPLIVSHRQARWAVGVAAYLNREKPAALLAMNNSAVTAAIMATHLVHQPVKVVATAHNNFQIRTHTRFYMRRCLRRGRRSYPFADAVVGVSRGVAEDLAGVVGVRRERIHTVYNPVVSDELLQRAQESPGHSWLDEPRSPVILAAGRLHKVKDFPVLLRAFAMLAKSRRLRLIVLGKGGLLPKLRKLAADLGIAGQVQFVGFVENPYAFFARASLFVLSSRREGLPTVLIEAMACGCPVVSTDCPYGPREILEGGKYGPIVRVGDSEALAAAMARTLDAPPARDTLRKRAAIFNVENAADAYEALLLGEQEPPRH